MRERDITKNPEGLQNTKIQANSIFASFLFMVIFSMQDKRNKLN